MEFTPQNLCGFLIRSRLMTPEEMRSMHQRWLAEAKENVNHLSTFTKWLVANQYVTEYQATLLAKGHGDPDVYFLNQYKILERLGRGRMAGVYKAVHTLGQTVAIKVLPPSRAKNPQMLARFQREARLALRLKHPNVVRTFQIGESNNLHYLVMEYLEGETLEDVLQRRKRMPPAEAVRLIHQALLGLEHIHSLGMVHRDLKPANMMLVPPPLKGTDDTTVHAIVKILDIGLGRALFEDDDTARAAKVDVTGEGVILGTPDYLAPEQARDPRNIDIRADIYSLGCVLYHLLSGQTPFPDSNLINQMVRHATENARPLQVFNPEIPDGLQQIVNYMMAKQAAQRYPTPERAAQALQLFLLAESQAPKPLEEAPQMRSYLTWLETSAPKDVAPAPPAPAPVAVATPVPTPAVTAALAPPAPMPVAKPPSNPGVPATQNSAGLPVAKPSSQPDKPASQVPARRSRQTPVPATQPAAGPHPQKHKKQHRPRPPGETAGRPAPVAPAAAPAVPPKAEPLEFDVELVPLPVPASGSATPSAKKILGITKRDWALMGVGAGASLVLFVLGMIVSWLL
jgi:serine/threonine protein kinase